MMYLYGVCGAHIFMVRMFVWCTCVYGARVCMMHECMMRVCMVHVYV